MKIEWPEGLKKTKQRVDVYKILASAENPMSAVDIFKVVPDYALSTIYRVLASFEKYDLVTKSTLPGEDMAVFELNKGEHKHYALCLKCHEYVPLKKCPFEHINIQTEENDFSITSHKIEIYGYCSKCKEG